MALNLTGAPKYEDVLAASQNFLRGQSADSYARVAQSIRNSGLRTSGVGQIPYLQAERNRSMNEAGLISQLSGQRLGQIGTQENMALAHQYSMEQLRLQNQIAQEAARAAANSSLQNALVAGGAGALTGWLGRR